MGDLIPVDFVARRRKAEYKEIARKVWAERMVARDERMKDFLINQLKKSGILNVNDKEPPPDE